jgi:REP element-mobilizing transposase RayT
MVQDHVHMLIRIPPKYAVAEVMGYIKGKSAIAVARQCGGRQRNFLTLPDSMSKEKAEFAANASL